MIHPDSRPFSLDDPWVKRIMETGEVYPEEIEPRVVDDEFEVEEWPDYKEINQMNL